MAILRKNSKYGINPDPESLTEQEHKDSCDINKMIAAAHRGQQIRGGDTGVYGYDDTTMDGVQFRIQKAHLENELKATASQHEFDENEFKAIPEGVRKKFNFKQKAPKPIHKNDDSTTNKTDGTKEPVEKK